MRDLRFPKGFLFGAASSAYQIEGFSREDGGGETIWDAFCRIPGAVDYGDTGAVACDSYHRAAEDIALLKELGVGAYRFSTSWARVDPRGDGGGISRASPIMTGWWSCAWRLGSPPT